MTKDNPQNFKMILFGDPGIGKTVLIGGVYDVPEMNPALIIDVEGNLDSIESKVEYTDIENCHIPIEGKITAVRVEDFPQFDEVFNRLNTMRDEFPYKTVIIDSFSALNFWSIKRIIATNNFKRSIKNVPGLEDFKANFHAIAAIIYNIKNWPAHIFATCHSDMGGSDEEGDGMIRPMLTGQLKQLVSGVFKQTFYLFQRNGERIIRFQPKGKFFAKDCSENGKFGQEMEKPTMAKLYAIKIGEK